ncbi:RNI-like protein [Mycena venus]|uniref:RNI-like protein n=1 Tax=Mycena venus TaxID=2733690 RepID=A0A8H6YEQ5_9AGAR|nr:RNI-like protein [Mycena venus]
MIRRVLDLRALARVYRVATLAAGAKRLQSTVAHDFFLFSANTIPDSIDALPRARPNALSRIAAFLFPHSEFTHIKGDGQYEVALSRVWGAVRRWNELRIINPPGHPISEPQGPWLGQVADPVSLDGPKARPMPVHIGTNDDFKDVFQFLHLNIHPKDVLSPEKQALRDELTRTLGLQPGNEIKWNTPMVEFRRGVVYDDGRLDLCKMVVGPTHIDKLLDALEENTVVTQFLLGNNVISTTGARRIARFIADHPERIETWYIAGNHIRAPGFQLLVDAMVKSPRITNVWLKRNPLTPDSVDNVVRLITQTAGTLDLENTELGDDGVARIMREITGKDLPLRNLYLNANAAGWNRFTSVRIPSETQGALPLAEALKSNRSLLRLSLMSTGLTSTGVSALCIALASHPRIVSLNLDSSSTTRVHGQRFNHLDDIAIPHIAALMRNPSLRHLDLGRTEFSSAGLEEVHTAVERSPGLCVFHAFRWFGEGEGVSCALGPRRAMAANMRRLYPVEARQGYENFARNSLAVRFMYSPEDVRLIDSVYRTRDKRDEKEVEQVWKEGDPVWRLVDEDV